MMPIIVNNPTMAPQQSPVKENNNILFAAPTQITNPLPQIEEIPEEIQEQNDLNVSIIEMADETTEETPNSSLINKEDVENQQAKDSIMFQYDLNRQRTVKVKSNKMINLEIFNGVLSDPDGPIILLSQTKKEDVGLLPTVSDLASEEIISSEVPLETSSLAEISEEEEANEEMAVIKDPPGNRYSGRSLSMSAAVGDGQEMAKHVLKRRFSENLVACGLKKRRNTTQKTLFCDETIPESFSESFSSSSDSVEIINLAEEDCMNGNPSQELFVKNDKDDSSNDNFDEPEILDTNEIYDILQMTLEVGHPALAIGKQHRVVATSDNRDDATVDKVVIKVEPQEEEEASFEGKYKKLKQMFFRPESADPLDLIVWKPDSPEVGSLIGSGLQLKINELGLLDFAENNKDVVGLEVGLEIDSKAFRDFVSPSQHSSRLEEFDEDVKVKTKCKNCLYIGPLFEFPSIDVCSSACATILLDKKPEEQIDPFQMESSSPTFWEKYLELTDSFTAPRYLFRNSMILSKGKFKPLMKLEMIDPRNAFEFTIGTVRVDLGGRIGISIDDSQDRKLYFYNYSSFELFPIGFCKARGSALMCPNSYFSNGVFSWDEYLNRNNLKKVYRNDKVIKRKCVFTSRFKVGWHLEAFDIKRTGRLRMACISNTIGKYVLVRFSNTFKGRIDYWCEENSPLINPINYHKKIGVELYSKIPDFSWSKYLKSTNSWAAPKNAFRPRKAKSFKVGMKLEAIDYTNPLVIRPATVTDVRQHEIKITYDLRPGEEIMSTWVLDDTEDIYPVKWCANNSHPLELEVQPETLKCAPSLYKFSARPKLGINRFKRQENDAGNLRKIHQQELMRRATESNQDRLFSLKPVIEGYGPSLEQNVNLWTDNMRLLTNEIGRKKSSRTTNPLYWSFADVRNYINAIPTCQHLGDFFEEQAINGEALLSISQDDLCNTMSLKFGTAIKIYSCIVSLRLDVATHFISQ